MTRTQRPSHTPADTYENDLRRAIRPFEVHCRRRARSCLVKLARTSIPQSDSIENCDRTPVCRDSTASLLVPEETT
jgi:hypothetical protein